MSETDSMNVDERRKYTHLKRGRYRDATIEENGRMLIVIEIKISWKKLNAFMVI